LKETLENLHISILFPFYRPTVLHLQIGNEVKEKRCGILRAYEVKDNYKRIFITTLLVVQHNQNVQTQGDRLIRVGCILTNIQSEKTAGIAEAQMGLLPSEGSITVNSNSMQLPKITMQIIDLNDRYETNDVQIGQNLE
uniref:Uncharacterized protein n=1 Tax=Megaselia scalaris TaxID=36166 RepID=T1GT28_MEGSC